MSDDYASEEGTYTGSYDNGYHSGYEGGYDAAYSHGDGTTGGGMEEQPGDRFAPGGGIWQPLTQNGEFDAEATMNTPFTGQLPDLAALPTGADPLAAPGHGYAPPAQVPAPASYDSAPPLTASGQWAVPADLAPLPGPDAAAAEQWSVPFVPEDPAEMSGEYSVGQIVGAPHEPPGAFEEPPAAGPGPEPVTLFEPAQTFEPAGTFDPVGVFDPAEAFAPVGAFEPPAVPQAPAGPPDIGEPADPGQPEGPGEPGEPGEIGEPDEDAGDLGPQTDPHSEHPTTSYVLTVNGADRPVTDAWLGESLLYVLRERLGLAGAKDGCEQGECGACSVQVDGRLVASCLMPAATAAGCEVRTVEGLARDGRPSDVQRALAECGAVQCGFCVPGLAMTMHDLLEGNHRPTELETRQALSGNLCRCSGYQGVLDAVREVIATREAAAEAADPGHDTPRIPHQSTGEPDGATS